VRNLIVTENITVDGVIDMAKGWFDPEGDPEGDTTDLQEAMQEQGQRADILLLGRQTFEDFRSYWPLQTDDTSGTADYLTQVAKYVVSSTLDEPRWENTNVLRGEVLDEVRALKALPGDMDIVVTGSMRLVARLIPPVSSTSTGCSSTRSWPARASACSLIPGPAPSASSRQPHSDQA